MKSCLSLLTCLLCASTALAEPPPSSATGEAAAALVEKQLVAPLARAKAKRKRFSRAAPVPTERRVRVLDETAQTDVRGKRFVRFAVDERDDFRGGDTPWNDAAIHGCVYPDEEKVYVQQGEEYFHARSTLGKEEPPVPHVCRAAPVAAAQAASSSTAQ